ncbi:MAG: response regulator [Epsilonproteobacteria bacterium]|nr:response regulator [Campylobacterota bacterium]
MNVEKVEIKPKLTYIDDNLMLSKEKRIELTKRIKYIHFIEKEIKKEFYIFFKDKIAVYNKDLVHIKNISAEIEIVSIDLLRPDYCAIYGNKMIKVLNLYENKLIAKIASGDLQKLAYHAIFLGFANSNELILYNLKNQAVFSKIKMDGDIKKLQFLNKSILFISLDNKVLGYNFLQKRFDYEIELKEDIVNFYIFYEKKIILVETVTEVKVYSLEKKAFIDNMVLREDDELVDIKEVFGLWVMIYKKNVELIDYSSKKVYHLTFDDKFENVMAASDRYKVYVLKEDYSLMILNIQDIFKKENDDKIRFLTVDDSRTMRLIIKNAILNNFKNVEVYEAENGLQCLEVLEKHPNVDVIFMDWNMPEMNGEEAVDAIRQNPNYKHIKIVMATTEGTRDKVQKMIKKGVVGYLVKPLRPDATVNITKKLIEKIKREREYGLRN